MDTPTPLKHTRTVSATFPLTHGSTRPNDVSDPFAAAPRHIQYTSPATDTPPVSSPTPQGTGSSLTSTSKPAHSHQHRHYHHTHHHSRSHSHIDFGLDGLKSRHKHSKSRDLRFPRPMSQLASASASARGLLPTWSREKDREDDGLLRPATRDQSRWGSDSTRGTGRSRRGSLLDVPEQHERLGPLRRQILSMEDLEVVRKRRVQGEECLRSALKTLSTRATDATIRLDYTYYALLEKASSLHGTISSLTELSEAASSFLTSVNGESTSLDTDIRKQLSEINGFEAQIEKITRLEERMAGGRKKVEELGDRLDRVRGQIEEWERRELEWQERVSRGLRLFWVGVSVVFCLVIVGVWLRGWSDEGLAVSAAASESVSMSMSVSESGSADFEPLPGWYPASLAERRDNLKASLTDPRVKATDAEDRLLRVLDEL